MVMEVFAVVRNGEILDVFTSFNQAKQYGLIMAEDYCGKLSICKRKIKVEELEVIGYCYGRRSLYDQA